MRAREVAAYELGLPGTRRFAIAGSWPSAPRMAIVGARAALRCNTEIAAEVVVAAGDTGHAVISGGAIGIDRAVHEAALAHGVAQIAVLPACADRPYPPANLGLFERMIASGRAAILFALPPGTTPTRGTFVSRNRWIVAAAARTVVVQAGDGSGSETTGRMALRTGQPVAAVLGSRGCAALCAAGATAIDPAHAGPAVRAAIAGWIAGARVQATWPPHLAWLRARLGTLGPAPVSLDRLGGPAAALAVFEAESIGLVIEPIPGHWAAA